MENIKHVGIIIHRMEDLWQGTRTALGLAVGNFYANLFLVNVPIEITQEILDNLEWLEDMECPCYSNMRKNEEYHFTYMPLETIAKKLKEMDIVVPFGNSIKAPPGKLAITWLDEAA
ncbi:MAG: hypothetical protein D6E12_16120 [Desulfovibrio sp.]|nr:MAG: hypothetical protein D6E12_16120 [Desulfovibrio sp.]